MNRLKLAIQKTGRLADDTLTLLSRCGLRFDSPKGRLIVPCKDFPLDLLMIRDDDIPGYVASGACDLGIVGRNLSQEFLLNNPDTLSLNVLQTFGFGSCRLSLAIPISMEWRGLDSLNGLSIATSYPGILGDFLRRRKIAANIVIMSGAVEIAPAMKTSDVICDLVSSGSTLLSNGLREVAVVMQSDAVLVGPSDTSVGSQANVDRLLLRMAGVQRASQSRYIMMNARKSDVESIRKLTPGLGNPTVTPLAGSGDRVAIHVVAKETVFWETLESLKSHGASDILVMQIEKILE